jgi:hypothetical protein
VHAFPPRNTRGTLLREGQPLVLDLHNWHSFLHAVAPAGFRSADMISSELALISSYALFLIRKHQCHMPHHLPCGGLDDLLYRARRRCS